MFVAQYTANLIALVFCLARLWYSLQKLLVLIRDSFGRKVESNKGGKGEASSNADKVMNSNFLSFLK